MRWLRLIALVVFTLATVAQAPRHGRAFATENLTKESEVLQPMITTSELVVGENRFAFGLFQAQRFLEKADVAVRLYAINGNEAQLDAELKARYQPIAKVEPGPHRHADGTRHMHREETGVPGLYVAQVTFARAGPWGIEILAHQKDRAAAMARFMVNVLDAPATLAVGSSAPRSRNLIASDVKDLREIDTSPRPDPRLHQIRIADAIAQGKPQVIVFATPQFCTTRMCGPVVDIVTALLPAYGKRVAFTHQEIWQDFFSKKAFSTVDEWRLSTEPWIFLVDGQGIIRAKFEGLVTAQELEISLQEMLKTEPARRR